MGYNTYNPRYGNPRQTETDRTRKKEWSTWDRFRGVAVLDIPFALSDPPLRVLRRRRRRRHGRVPGGGPREGPADEAEELARRLLHEAAVVVVFVAFVAAARVLTAACIRELPQICW